jgi:hypothetical protein
MLKIRNKPIELPSFFFLRFELGKWFKIFAREKVRERKKRKELENVALTEEHDMISNHLSFIRTLGRASYNSPKGTSSIRMSSRQSALSWRERE